VSFRAQREISKAVHRFSTSLAAKVSRFKRKGAVVAFFPVILGVNQRFQDFSLAVEMT
jgi:hypothetical protein